MPCNLNDEIVISCVAWIAFQSARPRKCYFAKMRAHSLYIPPFSAMLPFSLPIPPTRECQCQCAWTEKEKKGEKGRKGKEWNAFFALSKRKCEWIATNDKADREKTREIKSGGEQGDWSIVFELPNYFEFCCFLLSCSIGILPSHGGTRVHTVCHVGSAVKLWFARTSSAMTSGFCLANNATECHNLCAWIRAYETLWEHISQCYFIFNKHTILKWNTKMYT